MNELRIEDPQAFFNFLGMEPAMFDELVQRIGPRTTKTDYWMETIYFNGLILVDMEACLMLKFLMSLS